MKQSQVKETLNPFAGMIPSGNDLFGEHRSLGVSTVAFKIVPHTAKDVLIIENTFHKPGGPARHLHYFQDEWFYILNGNFIFEVGEEKFQLKAGDSLMAPRRIAHVWACTENNGGSILIAFMPAGKMEAFFREVTKTNAMPPQDPELWKLHEMELAGPPLKLLHKDT